MLAQLEKKRFRGDQDPDLKGGYKELCGKEEREWVQVTPGETLIVHNKWVRSMQKWASATGF